ncbi:hypothetical protein WG66_001141, partial [Moniliophthora roreri]
YDGVSSAVTESSRYSVLGLAADIVKPRRITKVATTTSPLVLLVMIGLTDQSSSKPVSNPITEVR